MAHHHKVYHRRPEKRLAQIRVTLSGDTPVRAQLEPRVLEDGWQEVPWEKAEADFIGTYPAGKIADWGWRLDYEHKRCWKHWVKHSYSGDLFSHSKNRYDMKYELVQAYTRGHKPDLVEEYGEYRDEIYFITWSFFPWVWWRRFPGYGGAWKQKQLKERRQK